MVAALPPLRALRAEKAQLLHTRIAS
jgi:hypothetical protein